MSTDNLIGIALGVVSLAIAAIMVAGAFAEGRRALKAYAGAALRGSPPIG